MKVILLKDIPKIGRKHDVKEINDGYAVNFLLPKKLVEPATAKKLALLESMRKNIQIEKKIQSELLAKNLTALRGLELVMKGKASETGHLFSGIRREDIIEKMKKDYRIEIAPECLELEKPIKEIGEYQITVSGETEKAKFKLIIGRE